MDTTNEITVLSPRWHDRMVLIASWRVVEGLNRIKMPKARNHPDYYMTGFKIRQYPTEVLMSRAGKAYKVYAVPLADLEECTDKPQEKDGFRQISVEEYDNLIKTGKL